MEKHAYQCPCCNNPWNTASFEGKGTSNPLVVEENNNSVSVCGSCMSQEKDTGIDPANFD